MRASPSNPSNRGKEEPLVIVLFAGVGLATYTVGFFSGWKRGQRHLLTGLERAMRIQRHLKEE